MEENSHVQTDREILPENNNEENLTRSSQNCPEYIGMMICVDSFENGLAQGRLHTNETPIHFLSLDQLLFAMEGVMDRAGTPQAWTEKRAFSQAKGKRKKAGAKKVSVQKICPVQSVKITPAQKGRVANFCVRVHSRMNSSMQGIVTDVESSERVAFRSELELLYLIREILSGAKNNR